ncbi:MAG: ChrR family anti-sigma-E factor [Paracoccaceae bacterium]
MSIKHHLTEGLIMGYSAGTLPEAFNLVIATHVSLCDECRALVESYDALGGAMLDTGATATMGSGALDATLALIAAADAETADAPCRDNAPRASGVFPAPLRDYVGGDLDAVKWRPAGGGVKQALLSTSKDATVRLIQIPAGAKVPDHGHQGTELTLVLQGAFRDETARFGRGDIEVADEELQHTPVAEEGETCICLAATDAPLKFKDLLPRMAQPFLRI